MLTVVQAFDRAPITEVGTDDAATLERKVQAAERVFRDRDGWLKPHERVAILRRLAALMEGRRDHLAMQIAREDGKPLPDAVVETNRAIDGTWSSALGRLRCLRAGCGDRQAEGGKDEAQPAGSQNLLKDHGLRAVVRALNQSPARVWERVSRVEPGLPVSSI